MRVHELAKAVQLESKDVLAIAKRHRMGVKQSPSANVEDKDVRKLMPLIEKFKADQKAKAEEDRKRKEEELRKKEEERRKKEEERRRTAEEKRKSEEEARLKKEEEERAAAQKRAEDERRQKDEAAKQAREAEKLRREEEERLRSLGLRVPARPANYVPTAPPAPEPPTRPAPRVTPSSPGAPSTAAPSPSTGTQPGAAPDSRPRPQQGQYQPRTQQGQQGQYQSRPQGQYQPRPQGPGGPNQRPQGQRPFRPGEGRPPQQGGFRPGEGRPPQQGGFRPGGGRPDRPQGDRPYTPRQPGDRPSGPRPDRPYDRGPRPPGQQGARPDYRQGGGRPGEGRPFNRPDGGQRGPGGPPRRDDGRPAKLTEENLPTIGVMRLDKPAGRRDKDRDKKPKTGDKRNKVAPRRIFELDEDMTVTTRPRLPGKGGTARPAMRHGFGSKRKGPRPSSQASAEASRQAAANRLVRIEGDVTVAQFAEKTGIPATEIIKKVLLLGEMLNLNQIISPEMMELLGTEFDVNLEVIRDKGEAGDIEAYLAEDDPEKMIRRSPVVTIMGHVDHGKTSLLDYIRNSKVVEGEFGGITQHIGAYHVSTSKGNIVFLDTPGHEAFTSMRARGTSVTDLVILVVAANDGFKPQTIEAVHHAQAGKVPIVVAVNKIDLPGADPAKVRQEALQHGMVPEEFGGDVIFVDISAKKGTGVDQLLEMVALQAEILDLKADPERAALGTVVESHIDPTRGAVATVLVQKGTLRAGDFFVAGDISGRVRAMVNDRGKVIKEAGPSFPVEIIGLTGSPPAGEVFLVVPDADVAREIAEKREFRRRIAGLAPTHQRLSLEGLHERIAEGKLKELNLIVKGDVQGSIEAISQSLEKLQTEVVRIKVIHTAVGGINESDVSLAAASDAIVIGFNVRPEPAAADLAAREGVDVKLYRIIYDLIEDVRNAMVGLLDPKFTEKVMGHAEIRQVFRASRIGSIAGCTVRDGEIARDHKVRLLRDNIVIYEGNIASLKRVKEDVRKVTAGVECGILIENFNDIREGDIIEAFQMEQIAATLEG